MRRTLRSLWHRNFRVYYLGQLVSLTGTWMQYVAQSWLLYRLTGSSLMLGLAGGAALLPNLFFGLWGGMLADRLPRRRLFAIAQVLAMMQALALAVLTLGGWVLPWHILLLAFLLGIVQAIELPARHSFVAQLVPRADLPNAIALNSSVIHLARFVGPAIAGWLVVAMGEGLVFLVNALTFLAVLGALIALRLPARADGAPGASTAAGLAYALRYAWENRTIRAALAMVTVMSLLGTSAAVLLPVFADRVFHSGAGSLGLLLGAIGAGALVGALTVARRGAPVGFERTVAMAAGGAGAALLLFASTHALGWALTILPVVGFCVTTLIASSNACVQLSVPDDLRGRIMALFVLALHGMMPLGHLAVGVSAEWIGAPLTVGIAGMLLLAAAVVYTRAIRMAHPVESG